MERASEELGVRKTRDGFGAGSAYRWSLPPEPNPPAQPAAVADVAEAFIPGDAIDDHEPL